VDGQRSTELTVSNRTVVRIVVIVIASLLVVRAVGVLHRELIWIAAAAFFALALEPLVGRLSRYMPWRSRALALVLVLVAVGSAVVFVIANLAPPFGAQAYRLVINLPSAYNQFANANPQVTAFVTANVSPDDVTKSIEQFSHQLLSFGGSAVVIVRSIFGGIVATVTTLLLTFFMVLEGPRWAELFWRYQPAAKRKERKALWSQLHKTITGYTSGNLITSLIAATGAAIGLFLLGTPYVLPLALLVGFVDLIPLVGATLAAVAVCTAVLVFDGPAKALIMVAYFIIYQQIENHLLVPLVFSKAVDVSPLVTTVALLIGVTLGGFIGALVAIPAAASAQILARYWLDRKFPERRRAQPAAVKT
jgi:predicted PurR-regulated permease PerM